MINNLVNRYPQLAPIKQDIEKAVKVFKDCYYLGGKILLMGNGGSASDCEHIAGELLKGFMLKRSVTEDDALLFKTAFPEDSEKFIKTLQRGIPAISLPSQIGVLSAYANDVEPDMVYAQLVYAYNQVSDVAVGLSTSGNSKNVVNGLKVAKALGLKTVAFTGSKPCALDSVCNVLIKVPETETYKVQELHLAVYHAICAQIESDLFGDK
ncbi:MAG: SIS domain-containing protein [Clostridia bacterium]|nr:SIS domain-containing protein [Clostridia bacterium]